MGAFAGKKARATVVTLALGWTVTCGGSTTSPPSSTARACIPGASMGCVGAGGCAGFQVCDATGSKLGECVCAEAGASSDGGSGSGSGADSGAASDSGSDSGSGAGADATADTYVASSSSSGSTSSSGASSVDSGFSVSDCPGPLSGALATTLTGADAGAGTLAWLYPYDGTVFPQGLAGPVLQWSQTGTPDGVYLHLWSTFFDYKGCFAGSSPPRLSIPRTVWDQAQSQSNGAGDPLHVQLTTSTGGALAGTLTAQWTIALGTLKGLVYYDTYTSPIAGMASMSTGGNGAVMMLKPGNAAPTPLLAISGMASPVPTGPCISCHSVSASGSMLVASREMFPGGLQSPGSESFNLLSGLPNATSPTPLASTTSDQWSLAAVYPDGSRLLTAGESQSSTAVTALFPVNNGNNPGMIGPKTNVMYDPRTGSTITFTGLSSSYAMMPAWSPDGKKIVFNDVDHHGGHALVVQDFDASTNTFSNPVVVYAGSTTYPGWPNFTPDGASVVFALGASNFASIPPGSFSSVGPVQAAASDVASSDLYIVPVTPSASAGDAGVQADAGSAGTAQALGLANGYRRGASYMPFPGRDEHLGFYPSVGAVASGGYFWVVFTSRRQYGNVMVDTTNGNALPDPVFHAETKKIWVTALTIGATGDPSHPAFLLPGQEAASGDYRPTLALAPCKASGQTCTTGVECCAGGCAAGTCAAPGACSAVDEKCTSPADCCNNANLCIAGFCAIAHP